MFRLKSFKKTKSKFGNIKTSQGDSKAEVKRYYELLLLEKQGHIKNIEKQPEFILMSSFKYAGKTERGMKYTADFKYFDIKKNKTIIEEVKSSYTAKLADYVIRRKLFKMSILKDFDKIEFVEILK
jgi:hypothetical protein